MTVLSASRETTCTGCGAVLRAGRRGPLPRRCPGCRRRPVLPERVAGRTACLAAADPSASGAAGAACPAGARPAPVPGPACGVPRSSSPWTA